MSIGFANTYDLDIGGGGSSPTTPLVAGSNPAAQYAAAGTTSLTFAFPAASGGTGTLTYGAPSLVKPSGSAASVSGTAPGNITINNTSDTEAYLIRVVVSDASGQQVLNDALGSIGESAFVPLAPVVAPVRQALASTDTSASVTFTQPGAPGGMVYAVAISNVTTGAVITPSSGSDLGPYAFAVQDGNDYIVTLAGTAIDGQVSTAVAEVAVSAYPAFAATDPSPQQLTSGTTSTTITFPAPTGGDGVYVVGTLALVYDSTEDYLAAATAGSGLGPYTISNLAAGGVYTFELPFTDGLGQSAYSQASIVVNAGVTSITFASEPADQSLSSTAISATIGTWGAVSGGTGPYTYAVTALGSASATISGSGLGPYTASGLTAGSTYTFLMTVTDSLSNKGYSVVTIVTAESSGTWETLLYYDLTDSDWTAVSTTSRTSSTTVPLVTIYGADGVTPKLQIWNTNTDPGRLQIAPSGPGLELITTSIASGVAPGFKVVPVTSAGTNIFQLINWTNDLVKVEFTAYVKENPGTAAFITLTSFSSNTTNGATQYGFRIITSGTTIVPQRRSWTSAGTSDINQTAIAGLSPYRLLYMQWEGYVTGSRTVESYAMFANTPLDLPTVPRSGKYYMAQAASQTQTTTPAKVSFDSTTASSQFGIMMYLDGSVIDSGSNISRLILTKIKVSRFPNGSLLR